MIMKRAVVVMLVVAASFVIPAQPVSAENTPQPLVWYRIDAQLKLDEQQHPTNLEGREQVVWLNDSTDTISDLQFHLYLNAFKNEKSTFFKESGGQLRGDRFEPGQWGWIDINQLRQISLSGGEDLTRKIEFIHPDDGNPDDQTVIRVPLSRPVRPGEKITLELSFTARLPRVYARTGYWGQFALVAQWFPKLGVWEAKGERRREQPGWNCHQFHANSEFYADFGVFDVNLTVPSIYKDKIGATGVLKSEKVNQDGSLTYNFYQENVHDFAWTVDSTYLKVTRAFKADEQVKPAEIEDWSRRLNLPVDRIRLNDVSVTLLIHPEHRGQIDRHFAAAFNAIKYFGLWYGKYPYPTLTVVDPPFNGEGAGGMEYPTFITAGTPWWLARDQNPEEVIIHEYGHQYWYGLVANNEFEESWMDEGFNTYSTSKVVNKAYGANVFPVRIAGTPLFYLPLEAQHPYEDRVFTLRGKFNDPIPTPSWKYFDSTSYGLNSYPRTGLVLNTLERYLGGDLMARVMREYHEKWRYRHPTSEDFFETVNAVTGQDFGWFFDQFVKGTATLDYEIAEAKSESLDEVAGIYDQDGRKTEVKADDEKKKTAGPFQTEVMIRRAGEAWFPVELLLSFKDGSRITARPAGVRDGVIEYKFESSKDGKQWTDTWPIRDRWKKIKLTTESELLTAQLDPDQKILLDANLTNNGSSPSTGAVAALRWSSGLMFWVQAALQSLGVLG